MKKYMILSLLLIMSTVQIGCASKVTEKNYYQLSTDFDSTVLSESRKIEDFIWLESITVADHLNNNSIVYQQNEWQFTAANNNLWVSPLGQMLTDITVHDLSVLLPNRLIANQAITTPKTKIKLMIDSFHGRYSGDAIIEGRWIITDNKGKMTVRHFNYAIALKKDGYDALVGALSQGWQETLIDLVKNVKL